MLKFAAYLRNSDCETHSVSPFSFSSGQYGFNIEAKNLEEAVIKTVLYARNNGFYNFEWQAMIKQVKPKPICYFRNYLDTIIYLSDDIPSKDRQWREQVGYELKKLPNGGVLVA